MPEVVDFESENGRHKKLGKHGEKLVFYKERSFLQENKRNDLAKKVELVSEKDSSAGYDILSYEPDGTKNISKSNPRMHLLQIWYNL